MATPVPVPVVPQPIGVSVPLGKPPSASLYVGDLLPEVGEGALFELFNSNSVQGVSSIRVCRDTHTRRSLGYAYVNFHSVVDAERALDTLNNTLIQGKPCRIMWSQRDPTVRRSGVGNVFIKNLDPKITHKELYDTFSQFGSILSCKVAMNEHGESKGYGFVHFESQRSAEQAMGMVNDMQIVSKKVFVGPFIPRKVRNQHLENSWTNVYVKDIDPSVTDEQFAQLFGSFGRVTSPVVVRKDGQPSYYGFVNFEKHEDATKAVNALNDSKLNGKTLFCCRAQKKLERRQKLKKEWEQAKYQGTNLYIKNIEDEIDEDRLKKEFSAFGNVLSHKIMSENGNSKGFGFVSFGSQEEAARAIQEMSGKVMPGCSKPLYVAVHEPKEVRRAKLATQRLVKSGGFRGGAGAAVPPGMYPPGAPVFYPNNVPQGYYPTMVPGGVPARPWPAQAFPQAIPSYAPANHMPIIRGGTRGGRGGPSARGTGAARQPGPRGRNQIPIAEQEFSLQMLSQFPFEQQKLLLGEKLYPVIGQTQPQLAGKITGMFLDSGWSIEELFSLLGDEAKLREKIEDALAVLERAQAEAVAKGEHGHGDSH